MPQRRNILALYVIFVAAVGSPTPAVAKQEGGCNADYCTSVTICPERTDTTSCGSGCHAVCSGTQPNNGCGGNNIKVSCHLNAD